MSPKDLITIKFAILAGTARAIHDRAEKGSLQEVAQEFRTALQCFEDLLHQLNSGPEIAAAHYSDHLSELTYRLAATSSTLKSRISKREPFKRLIGKICSVIDTFLKCYLGMAPIRALFDVFVEIRALNREAGLIPGEILTPALPREISARAGESTVGKILPTAPPVLNSSPLPKAPSVRRRSHAEPPSFRGSSTAWTAPPPVLQRYKVEVVGTFSISQSTKRGP